VIDSLLFVFGFRASDIRMKRAEELIHNSSVHDDVKYASVTINFSIVESGA
jgi:structural maintenance of chromosome 4